MGGESEGDEGTVSSVGEGEWGCRVFRGGRVMLTSVDWYEVVILIQLQYSLWYMKL
jgi:hypothetical protein